MFISKACAIWITFLPMCPAPIIPSVFPFTSTCGTWRFLVKLSWFPHASIFICTCIAELRFNIIMIAVCATRSVLYDGILQTVIPFFRVASRSMLLYPVPASQISLTDSGNFCIISALTGISFVTIIFAPWIRSDSCCSVVSSYTVTSEDKTEKSSFPSKFIFFAFNTTHLSFIL